MIQFFTSYHTNVNVQVFNDDVCNDILMFLDPRCCDWILVFLWYYQGLQSLKTMKITELKSWNNTEVLRNSGYGQNKSRGWAALSRVGTLS